MDKLVNFFKLLSDETRLRILVLLYHKELFVCELCGILDLPQPKVSKHLAKLRDMGFVKDKRQDQFILYYLNIEEPLFRDIIGIIVNNIENHAVIKKDIEKLQDKDKFFQLCRR